MREHPSFTKKFNILYLGIVLVLVCTVLFFVTPVYAIDNRTGNTVDRSANDSNSFTTGTSPYNIGINLTTNGDQGGLAATLRIVLALTVLGLAPSILILLTSFTRIIVVLHFVRSALTTQTTPPNQVLVGLALFLTWFIMSPIFIQINTEAVKPLTDGKINFEQAYEVGIKPLRTFMYKQTNTKDIRLFLDIAGIDEVKDMDEIPTNVLIPAFIISELRAAFIIGFCIYIPFLVIDMVVSSTLMSMGMMMLPPTTISMPFKILLFIMVDGWDLVIGNLVKSFVK
ncbi:MAG: flagellar type III secretion system pore protein FliP [Catonella sp.]